MRYDEQRKASWTALPSAPPRYPAAAHQAWLPPKNIDLLGEYALLLFHRFCICYVFVELVYRDMIILVGIYRQTRNGEPIRKMRNHVCEIDGYRCLVLFLVQELPTAFTKFSGSLKNTSFSKTV